MGVRKSKLTLLTSAVPTLNLHPKTPSPGRKTKTSQRASTSSQALVRTKTSSKPASPVKINLDHDYCDPPLPQPPVPPDFAQDVPEIDNQPPQPQSSENIIKSLEEKVKKLEQENASLKRKLGGVSKLFCDVQIELLCGDISKVHKWPDYVIQNSIHKYFYCGTKGYQLLRDMGYPLPCITTIVNRLQKFQYAPGILAENFQLLAHHSSFLKKEDMYATLMQDEMAIQPRIEYNTTTKAISGKINFSSQCRSIKFLHDS